MRQKWTIALIAAALSPTAAAQFTIDAGGGDGDRGAGRFALGPPGGA